MQNFFSSHIFLNQCQPLGVFFVSSIMCYFHILGLGITFEFHSMNRNFSSEISFRNNNDSLNVYLLRKRNRVLV